MLQVEECLIAEILIKNPQRTKQFFFLILHLLMCLYKYQGTPEAFQKIRSLSPRNIVLFRENDFYLLRNVSLKK